MGTFVDIVTGTAAVVFVSIGTLTGVATFSILAGRSRATRFRVAFILVDTAVALCSISSVALA